MPKIQPVKVWVEQAPEAIQKGKKISVSEFDEIDAKMKSSLT